MEKEHLTDSRWPDLKQKELNFESKTTFYITTEGEKTWNSEIYHLVRLTLEKRK